MNINIGKFRDIATSGQELDRVKVKDGDVVKGTKSWGFNGISKFLGMITGSRRAENKNTYHEFKKSLEAAYGEAGVRSLEQHVSAQNSGKALSTFMIENVIAWAEAGAASGKTTQGAKAAISSEEQYRKLPQLDFLSGGQIMIKKDFNPVLHGHGSFGDRAISTGITTGQQLWKAGVGKGVRDHKTEATVDGQHMSIKPKFLGHHSSEHAGIALDSKRIGEAVGEGLKRNDTTSEGLRSTKYVVYEPKDPKLKMKMMEIGQKLTEKDPSEGDGQYKLMGTKEEGRFKQGAIGSLWSKPRINAQETGWGTVEKAKAYLAGKSDVRPDVFCSEFAAICLELAHQELYGTSATGADPNGVSPMHLEDIVHSRPDLFEMKGRYEGANAKEAPVNFDQQEVDSARIERENNILFDKYDNLNDAINNTQQLIIEATRLKDKSESLVKRFDQQIHRNGQEINKEKNPIVIKQITTFVDKLKEAKEEELKRLEKNKTNLRSLENLLSLQTAQKERFDSKVNTELSSLD